MYKSGVYLIIYLSIVISAHSGALERYTAPQQQSEYTKQTTESSIYDKFRNRVSGLSPEERNKIQEAFREKMQNAAHNHNYEEAAYFKNLIDILNSFKGGRP